MAKKTAAKRKGKVEKEGKSKSGGTRILIMLFLIGLIPFSIPTLMLLFAGMLPTLVAALTDRSISRYAWICVGGLNFAGLAPALLKLWFGHHEVTFALGLITDVRAMLPAYGAAALGWGLYFAAPPIVITIMIATSKRRAAAMIQQMKKLEEEWGDEVINQAAVANAKAKEEEL
jgi:hypothetical protein